MAPPPLPSSLSPHICILPSLDLVDLLRNASLPPLHHVLQSFSPLPQVTTRTTSLVSVPHQNFSLRFSDLTDIERECLEDEEQRAARTLDWIGERISRRCARWVEDVEKLGAQESARTPWWDEIKRCAEGDHIPSKTEGWNYPITVIFAVSTAAPNPLQAITTLHSRPLELPPWVDTSSLLRYTLILHPQGSPLTNEEAGALFNAVKKQYGLHSYLLPLVLPSPPPAPVPVPALMPRLPRLPSLNSPLIQPIVPNITQLRSTPASPSNDTPPTALNTLKMSEQDIQQTAKFVRELVVMSLIPWMEKCVVEWNENFSSTRRLPSRLFSSTRRLFGSSQAPTPTASPVPSPMARTHSASLSQSSMTGPTTQVSQLRRLAEFATILGDIKLAVSVWEALRKDGRGGSDILPLLLSPSPTLQLHASHAITITGLSAGSEPTASAQLRVLRYAARWDNGISLADFLSEDLSGERWLIWAAGKSEEVSSCLLLAHAALLSARKRARRRASLLYLSAANRLEKYGIKPLTMYFLRRAHDLYNQRPEKSLSPLFWESQNLDPSNIVGFGEILAGIEHPLGRLSYTTGDAASAARFFIGLLRQSPTTIDLLEADIDGASSQSSMDKVYLDDFRVAFQHHQATSSDKKSLSDLQIPFTLCNARRTIIRLAHNTADNEATVWEEREEAWHSFWKSKGKSKFVKGVHAAVGEKFWVDVHLSNPLNAEISLQNMTIEVGQEGTNTDGLESVAAVEVIDEVVLGPQEARTIPVAITPKTPATLVLRNLAYDFISLLPSIERLSYPGKRLNKTTAHWRQPTYAPGTVLKVEVKEAGLRLQANFVDDSRLILAQGEVKELRLWLSNTGSKSISEIWLVSGQDDNIWIDDGLQGRDEDAKTVPIEISASSNSTAPKLPHQIALDSPLNIGESKEISILYHAQSNTDALSILLVYRGDVSDNFVCAHVTRQLEVICILDISLASQPSRSLDSMFLVNLALGNISDTDVRISQVTTFSPTWKCTSLNPGSAYILPAQSLQIFLSATRWDEASSSEASVTFVNQQLRDVLSGKSIDRKTPPPLKLICCHNSECPRSILPYPDRHFLHECRRRNISHLLASSHPHIPASWYPYIFPLYHPRTLDVAVYWQIPSESRTGYVLLSDLTLGADHAMLFTLLEEAKSAKAARNMYAETGKEKMEIINEIRDSEWNAEMNPLVVTTQCVDQLNHDFSTGEPCQVPVVFTIRNYSLTRVSCYTLQLNIGEFAPDVLRAQYFGRLTFRGSIDPFKSITVKSVLWVTHPGTYTLGRWQLATDVAVGTSMIRRSYLQTPLPEEQPCIMIKSLKD